MRKTLSLQLAVVRYVLISALFAVSLEAGDIYVSGDGDNSASGGLESPFASISRATEEAQPGDTVWIGPGVYRETVRPARSGTAEARIVFRSLNSEVPPAIINGTEVINGPWTREGSSQVYSTPWIGSLESVTDQSDQIFVDGEMFDLLRWPKETNNDLTLPNNTTISSVDAYTFGIRGGPMTITANSFDQPNGRWEGAKAWVNISPPDKADGQGMTGDVLSTDGSSRQIVWEGINDTSKTGLGHNFGVFAGNEFYLFDPTPEGVEATGGPSAAMGDREWWINRETNRLYVRFPSGSDPEAHTVEAKQREWGFDLSDRSYITVRDLNLFATSITTDATPGVPKDYVVDSTEVVLDNLKIDYVTHFIDQNINKDWTYSYAGQSGIILSGSWHTIRNCEFQWSAGSCVSLVGREHRVYNNLMENFNYQVTEAAGINMGKERSGLYHGFDHKIGYNTLRSSAGGGVFYNNGKNSDRDFTGMLRIHHNKFYDLLHRMWDAGVLQTVGHDREGRLGGTRIDHNVIHGADGFLQIGIYHDFAGQLHIDHNVVYDSWAPISGNDLEYIPFHNNVALNGVQRFGFTPEGLVYGLGDRTYIGVSLRNNISTGDLSSFGDSEMEANLTGSRTGLVSLFQDSVNEDMNARDHSLAADAVSAIDQGVPVPGFNDPIIGDAPDIGAYEFGRPKWEAGYDVVPWWFDDDDSLRFAAQGVTIEGQIILHPFLTNGPVENLTVMETSPGISVELESTTATPDVPLSVTYTVAADAPAPSTGWFFLEGTLGGETHQQAITFRILPMQQLSEIRILEDVETPLLLAPLEQVHLPLRQYDADGYPMAVPVPLQWTATDGATFKPDGRLTAGFVQGEGFQAKASKDDFEWIFEFDVGLDWALRQPIEVSDVLNTNTQAVNAVDGDPGSAWVSGDSDDEWVIVDLGELVEIDRVEITWHISFFPGKYRVEASLDSETWELIADLEASSGGEAIVDGTDVLGRWLRITGGPEAASFTRLGILNLSVYGESAQDILGLPLTLEPGWRNVEGSFGWINDLTPGQHPHWVYSLTRGWLYIFGPGLFLRSEYTWGYTLSDDEWWWYHPWGGSYWYSFNGGWEPINP